MLAPRQVSGEPNLGQTASSPQIVDVPVRMGGDLPVVPNPRRQPTGSESAADVNVETSPQTDRTEPADGHHSRSAARQHQRVGAWLARERCSPALRPRRHMGISHIHAEGDLAAGDGGGKRNRTCCGKG
jgi:hypothetical protein